MIKSLLENEEEPQVEPEKKKRSIVGSGPEIVSLFDIPTGEKDSGAEVAFEATDDKWNNPDHFEESAMLTDYSPPSTADSFRMAGLAMSAGVALFGSVAFMMIVGWIVDLIAGTSPWGIVGGIVIGSMIGFLQFFRTNSEILKMTGKQKAKAKDVEIPAETFPLPEPEPLPLPPASEPEDKPNRGN
jgi:F0F1-type ATP synthase assembly protein I